MCVCIFVCIVILESRAPPQVIAFGGMQFSHSMVLNQFSLMLFACVLVDTFLVRTTLVPALVSLAGEFNWWPRQV
jgi:uncharacterized membrane protein YdfJ with MMPL/SSD domain